MSTPTITELESELLACQQENERLQKEMDRMVKDMNNLLELERECNKASQQQNERLRKVIVDLYENEELCNKRLEQARREAAAMREALEDCERTLRFSPYSGDTYRGAIDKAQAALATYGGRARELGLLEEGR